jgi:hypothetical protein
MIGMQTIRAVFVVSIALVSVACSGVPPTSSPASTGSATSNPSAAATAAAPTPEATPGIAFRVLDLPSDYSRGMAEAVDGTTAAGWVQIGINDEQPAIWDTTTGVLTVLAVPDRFVHPSGEIFTRLVGVSGTTAVGIGVLGNAQRGQERAMAWNTETGDLRILDIPGDFTQARVAGISGSTAIGQVITAHGEVSRPVAWDTDTGAVRILATPAGYEWVNPLAVGGDTIVGLRDFQDLALPLVWNPITSDSRDLDLLAGTQDGVPRAVDGTTAVGDCCFGEEGTPRPLAWDTTTGAVRQLDLPAEFPYGKANAVSGSIVIGNAESASLIWDLDTGRVIVVAEPLGYEESIGLRAVSGRTIVGIACPPAPSSSENPRCVPAAWTLP